MFAPGWLPARELVPKAEFCRRRRRSIFVGAAKVGKPTTSRSEKGNVLHVTCRSLPSQERRAAQQFLEGSIILEFVAWLGHFEKPPDEATIKREKPSFTRSWAPATA